MCKKAKLLASILIIYQKEKEIARSLIGSVITESRKQVEATKEEVTEISPILSTISNETASKPETVDHLTAGPNKRPSNSFTPVQLTPTADPLADESIDDISITTVIERKFSDSSNKQKFDQEEAENSSLFADVRQFQSEPLIQVEDSKFTSDVVFSSDD